VGDAALLRLVPAVSSTAEGLALDAIFAGDFRIRRLLAQGGMGSVYVADQLSTGRPRALKIMHAQYVTDPGLRQRFEQEAKLTAGIRSAHIVETVGAGIDGATGHPWIAMELLDGVPLDQRYPYGSPVSWDEARGIFGQLGHGLGATHDIGLVHRDLKPDNILICASGIAGLPYIIKLIDFGIAKVAQPAQKLGTLVVGSPLWMAPEQLDGRAELTTTADVWALGLLAFRLLTGDYYWENARSTDLAPIFQELSVLPIEPPTARVRALGLTATLPLGFDEWFLRCLRRKPTERFPSARPAIDALLSLLAAPGPRHAVTKPSPTGGSASAASEAAGTPPRAPTPTPVSARTTTAPRLVLRHRDSRSAEAFVDQHQAGLSLRGMRVETSRPLALGTRLRLEIRIAHEVCIARGTATVTRRSTDDMWLEFVQLEGALVEELAARARSSRPSGA
jgi:eukaryotic-like serine/threonine-protein kinase